MSLATRCTSCGTIFRIVQDQLKVSEGWVRCGRCDTVFNALEGLFDLERDDPPPVGAEAPPPAPAASGSAYDDPERTVMRPSTGPGAFGDYVHEATLPMGLDELPGEPVHAPASVARPGSGSSSGAPAGAAAAPTSSASVPPWVVAQHEESVFSLRPGDGPDTGDSRFEDARFPADAASDDSMARATAFRLESETQVSSALPTATEVPLDDLRPDFVRQADQRAFWKRPLVRAALSLLALVLAAAAALQATLQWHDEIAARWPAARPAVVAACLQLGCAVGAPRNIDQIVVESTALARTNLPDAYKLTVVLRNRADHVLAEPSIDLSLTDVSGGVVARRALAPTEFARRGRDLAAQAESTYELTFAVGNRRVTGYTVAVFYP